MQRPRLKAHLVPFVPDDATGGSTDPTPRAFFLTESGSHMLSGAAERAVLDHLDGTHSTGEIALALAGRFRLTDVVTALGKYARTGLVAEGPTELPRAETAYWDSLQTDPAEVTRRLAAAVVEIRAIGDLRVDGLAAQLATNRVGSVRIPGDREDGDQGRPPDLVVVLVEDYLDGRLAAVNAEMLALRRPWLPVKPNGYWSWYGPVFRPGDGPCWECLRQRVDSNRMVEQYLRQFGGLVGNAALSQAALPATVAAVEAMVAAAVVRRLVASPAPELTDRLVSIDHRNTEVSQHPVIRLPQCPSCGDPKVLSVDPAVRLEDRPIAFASDGGFRSVTPQATFDRLSKHVSRISGAVSWLEPLRTDDAGLSFSYSAGHNFAMVRNNITVLRKNLRGNSGGKGRTDIQAKVSGLCEAIERFSGVWSPDRPTVRSRAGQLAERHVLPNELMLFADEQFAGRRTTNADPANLLHRVPEPFDPDLSIDWTAAWSMTTGEPVQVPSAYVWFGHPDCTDHFFTYSDGNGNAAGNTLEEAILQGFFELVERDAVGIWWYNRLPRRGVDLASFADPYIDSLVTYYADMGRELWLLDLTTDLGIPTFASVSRRIDHPVEDIILAFGSHLDPHLAALRALTETNQFLPAVHGRRDDGSTVYLEEDLATLDWWRTARLADKPWLAPDPLRAAAASAEFPTPERTTVGDLVRYCVDRAAAVGHEVLVVDQSRPDLELRVAKVMSPGLRHFWRRLGPGRLYSHPVRVGDLAQPLTISELNPISVFF